MQLLQNRSGVAVGARGARKASRSVVVRAAAAVETKKLVTTKSDEVRVGITLAPQ